MVLGSSGLVSSAGEKSFVPMRTCMRRLGSLPALSQARQILVPRIVNPTRLLNTGPKAYLDDVSHDNVPQQFSRLVSSQFGGFGSQTTDRYQQYYNLTVSELQKLLEQAGIDFRDIFEKRELVQRLLANEPFLPSGVRRQLQAILMGGSQDSQPAEALAREGLFRDEQYVVSLFQAARPSVVYITRMQNQAGRGLNFNPAEIPMGSGSGFLWDAAGHVVTNYHVVRGAAASRVTLHNNETYDAVLQGAEPDKDLAVLKIVGRSSDTFSPISVGTSSNLQVGQRVFAIGNPFGLDQTLTAGIVSGLGREVKGVTGRVIRDVVQTDAAINPGNSGGPLLDSRGRLIGVNTMIYSTTGMNGGVGFAVPSDTVRRVVNQIIRHGRVIRPHMGVECLPDHIAASYIGSKNGVALHRISPGSGAALAGLRGSSQDGRGRIILGDVVVAVGGERVRCVEDLLSFIECFNVGDQVPITIRRNNQLENLTVTLLGDRKGIAP